MSKELSSCEMTAYF